MAMLAADTPPALSSPAPMGAATTQLIGVMATGPQADLDRLEAATQDAGFPCQQMDVPNGHELAVAFPPHSDPSRVSAYLFQLRGRDFAGLTFRSANVPPQ